MLQRTLDRIMLGAKTPEGKVIAILLTVSLALMTWNVASITYAFAGGKTETAELADQANDKSADDAVAASATTQAEEDAAATEPEPEPVSEPETADEPAPAEAAEPQDAIGGGV